MCVCVCSVPVEAGEEGGCIPWSRSCRWLRAGLRRCWGPNCCPLREQQELFIAEASLQSPPSLFNLHPVLFSLHLFRTHFLVHLTYLFNICTGLRLCVRKRHSASNLAEMEGSLPRLQLQGCHKPCESLSRGSAQICQNSWHTKTMSS